MQVIYGDFPFLTSILACCVIALVTVLLIPSRMTRAIKWVCAVASAMTLIVSLYLFITYDRSVGGLQFAEQAEWIPRLGISYHNGIDGFSVPMLLLTGIVFFTGVLTMWELNVRVKEFFALLISLVTGVFGMFMALDLFFIFVWYDVSLFPMYLLILIWGSTKKEYGAMKLMLYLLAGSALILPAIVYLVAASGLNCFDLVTLATEASFSPFQQKFAFFLFYIGFGILAGVWPFHTWSPVGHVAAPTAVSMMHAGVLMKIGAFGILRVGIFLCPAGWQYWAPFMAILAAIGVVYGVFVGLSQTDLKFVIGYSSVSHMGMVGLGLATVSLDGLNGAVFQMFAHGIMTALFFSAVGYIYDRTHSKQISDLGGLAKTMPVASGYFVLAALAGIGVPCLASFWAELLIFIGAFKVYPVLGILVICSLVISALFMLRVVQKTIFGPENRQFTHLQDVSFALGLPRMILAGTIVIFGLFPFLMYDTIQVTTMNLLSRLP
jgi:NADH-quinone oxidoreductase subunit M